MILASNSPQRKILLKKVNKDFKIIVSNADEVFSSTLSVYENVMNVAFSKAEAVRVEHNIKDEIIIGADTVCYLDGKTLGKPKNYDDAFNMIKSYNNKKQEVITGVSMIYDNGTFIKNYRFYDVSYVTFKNINDDSIKAWLSKDDYLDKAGSYAIQKSDNFFNVEIDGSLDNIIGLPVEKIVEILPLF